MLLVARLRVCNARKGKRQDATHCRIRGYVPVRQSNHCHNVWSVIPLRVSGIPVDTDTGTGTQGQDREIEKLSRHTLIGH